MYHAACKVEFQPFTRSYSQLTFFNFLYAARVNRTIFHNHAVCEKSILHYVGVPSVSLFQNEVFPLCAKYCEVPGMKFERLWHLPKTATKKNTENGKIYQRLRCEARFLLKKYAAAAAAAAAVLLLFLRVCVCTLCSTVVMQRVSIDDTRPAA